MWGRPTIDGRNGDRHLKAIGISKSAVTMQGFFAGWRRKVGCGLLVMAIILAGIWMRSCFIGDEWFYAVGNRQYLLLSTDGHLSLSSWETTPRESQSGWKSISRSDPLFLWNTIGIQGAAQRQEHWTRGYWQLPIQLGFLSACLILWKPKTKPTATEQSGLRVTAAVKR